MTVFSFFSTMLLLNFIYFISTSIISISSLLLRFPRFCLNFCLIETYLSCKLLSIHTTRQKYLAATEVLWKTVEYLLILFPSFHSAMYILLVYGYPITNDIEKTVCLYSSGSEHFKT